MTGNPAPDTTDAQALKTARQQHPLPPRPRRIEGLQPPRQGRPVSSASRRLAVVTAGQPASHRGPGRARRLGETAASAMVYLK